MKHLLKITFLIYTLYLLLLPQTISAQQISLSISPPILETVIKPGKSILVAYKLENGGEVTIIKPYVVSFIPKDNLGHIAFKDQLEGPIRFSLDNSDLELGKPFLLKPDDSTQLLLRIKVPENTPEGDYYYSLLAETQSPPTVEGITSGKVKATIGSNILINVTQTGQSELKGKIALFDILPRYKIDFLGLHLRFFDSNDTVPLIAIVSNQSKHFVKPEGQITLKGAFGEKATYDVVPENILEESERVIDATPSANLDCTKDSSLCKPNSHPSLLLSGFFIGKYTLSTEIDFGENSPHLFANTSFIAIPFGFVIGIILSLIIGLFIIIKIRRDDEELGYKEEKKNKRDPVEVHKQN